MKLIITPNKTGLIKNNSPIEKAKHKLKAKDKKSMVRRGANGMFVIKFKGKMYKNCEFERRKNEFIMVE